jgi:RNA polymerase sigma-70 factor, ECF subfamily
VVRAFLRARGEGASLIRESVTPSPLPGSLPVLEPARAAAPSSDSFADQGARVAVRVVPTSNDTDLVARLRRRQPEAFTLLYGRYREPLWRLLVRLTRNVALAEDLFQDTWLSAARHAHRLAEDTRLLPWLCTIARNKHRNALRLRLFDDLRAAGVGAEPVATPPAPDQAAELRARARTVAAAFARLPEAYQEVLVLNAVDGLDSREIGAVLELRPEAVRKRLSRARSELTRLLGRER